MLSVWLTCYTGGFLSHLLPCEPSAFFLALSLADILRECSLEILCSGSGKENVIGRRLGAFVSFQGIVDVILSCGIEKISDISVRDFNTVEL